MASVPFATPERRSRRRRRPRTPPRTPRPRRPRMKLPESSTRSDGGEVLRPPSRDAGTRRGLRDRVAHSVGVQVRPVIVDRAAEAFLERDPRRPAEGRLDERVLRVVVADVDPLALGGEVADRRTSRCPRPPRRVGRAPRARRPRHRQGCRRVPIGVVAGREKEGVDGVVDIREVAKLFAAPDLERLVADGLRDPDPEEGLPRVLHSHVRAVGVREAQRGRPAPRTRGRRAGGTTRRPPCGCR